MTTKLQCSECRDSQSAKSGSWETRISFSRLETSFAPVQNFRSDKLRASVSELNQQNRHLDTPI